VTESIALPPPHSESNMMRTNPNQPRPPFQDRLLLEVSRLKEEAKALPPGRDRDAMIRRVRQAETASHMDEWLSSPGLQSPR